MRYYASRIIRQPRPHPTRPRDSAGPERVLALSKRFIMQGPPPDGPAVLDGFQVRHVAGAVELGEALVGEHPEVAAQHAHDELRPLVVRQPRLECLQEAVRVRVAQRGGAGHEAQHPQPARLKVRAPSPTNAALNSHPRSRQFAPATCPLEPLS
eukprot:3807560-Pyramimonas_sp.AAC.1